MKYSLRKTDALLAALVLISLAIGAMAGWWISSGNTPVLPVQHIGNAFIDMNADGLPDFVLNAEVILNPGSPLAPTSPAP